MRFRRLVLGVALALVALAAGRASAQVLQNAVGGVSVDPRGVISNVEVDQLGALRELRAQALDAVPGDLAQPSPLRKISLRALQAALVEAQRNGGELADEFKYLAGLQRVQYVFVYPERNDIVLAGYGEGWTVSPRGEVVGLSTGRPVLQLDDLLVALRTAETAAKGGISCSIDPRPEGLERLRAFMQQFTTIGPNPDAVMQGIEEQLGPQVITVTGVPPTSHFAQVLVAADYRMKRLAMNFEEPPMRGLPSYLHMAKVGGAGLKSMMPRWWLAPHYEPVLKAGDGLAWELRGQGVKALAEEDYLTSQGGRVHSGRASGASAKWAENFTAKYDELSLHDPVFGQLRNIMDLSIVATLIARESLAGKAGLALTALASDAELPIAEYPAPRAVDSKTSFVKKGKNWMISASGGVQFQPWAVAEQQAESAELAPLRSQAAASADNRWWWD